MDRVPYSGDVAAVTNSIQKDSAAPEGDVPMRASTRHAGVRDLHESSFSLSGACLRFTLQIHVSICIADLQKTPKIR